MAAFQDAVEVGYRYLETDVWATRDGVLLAFHDATLDRLTPLTGRIEAYDYAQLRGVRVGDCEPIPLLEDLLGAWPDVCVNIDPKHDRAVEPLVAAIERTGAHGRVCVGSFSTTRLKHLRARLGSRVCTAAGPGEVLKVRLSSLGVPVGGIKADCLQVPLRSKGIPIIDRRFLALAEALGVPVHAWTVNDQEEMNRLIDLGVRGIMTDRPRRLKEVLLARDMWPH